MCQVPLWVSLLLNAKPVDVGLIKSMLNPPWLKEIIDLVAKKNINNNDNCFIKLYLYWDVKNKNDNKYKIKLEIN